MIYDWNSFVSDNSISQKINEIQLGKEIGDIMVKMATKRDFNGELETKVRILKDKNNYLKNQNNFLYDTQSYNMKFFKDLLSLLKKEPNIIEIDNSDNWKTILSKKNDLLEEEVRFLKTELEVALKNKNEYKQHYNKLYSFLIEEHGLLIASSGTLDSSSLYEKEANSILEKERQIKFKKDEEIIQGDKNGLFRRVK